MKNFLNKKISVKSLLVLMVVVVTMTVAIAAVGTRVTATLSPNISITYNGVAVTPVDGLGNITYPLVYNNSTYLPVRAISTILGLDIGWNQETQTISLNTAGPGGVQPPPPPAPQSGSIPAAGGTVNVNGTTRFTFTPSQSGVWQFRTSNNNNCDPYLWLYDSAGRLLSENDDSDGSLNATIIYNLTAGSTYTINAGFYGSGTGNYTLTASLAPTIPADGGSVNVNAPAMYAFTPAQSGIWTFRTSNNSTCDPYLIIFDESGNYLDEDDDSGGNLNAMVSVPLTAGRTYIINANLFWDDSRGSYTLTVSRTTPAALPSSGGTVTVNSATYFTFSPAQSGTWQFSTSNATGECDPFLVLFDSNGNRLAYDDDGAGFPNARLTHYLNAGTTYYLYARYYYAPWASDGSYTLSVSRV